MTFWEVLMAAYLGNVLFWGTILLGKLIIKAFTIE